MTSFDDEYDPLAPPRSAGGADEPADDDAPADGGVASSEGIVRVWFDDDRSLAKVRLSPVWFTKLDTPEELERAFAQAFRLAAARVATVGPRPSAEVTDEEMGEVPELTNDSLAAAIAELAGMFGEWDEALERHLATPRPAPPRAAPPRTSPTTSSRAFATDTRSRWPASTECAIPRENDDRSRERLEGAPAARERVDVPRHERGVRRPLGRCRDP